MKMSMPNIVRLDVAFSSAQNPHTILWVLKKFQWLVILFVGAIFLDTISTMYFMINSGIDLELHPLVRLGAEIYGPVLGTFLMAFLFKILGGLLVAAYIGAWAPYFLIVTSILSGLAGIYNFFGHLFF